ncbi:MAG: PatB family C-S lyase [Prolixibacteraceae bacterium]|nr:PatB family C-S lyase [Prolixibacteraceae bacterium]
MTKIYDFDELIDRTNTQCEKYDSREKIFGNADVIPLWVADTDFKTPDFIVQAVKERAAHEVYGYPITPDSFYEAIEGWLERRHQWTVNKETIQYAPNVVIALASIVLSMTRPGDKIVVQPPVYFPFFQVIEGNGRIVVENPLKVLDGRYHFDLDDLRSKIDENTKMLFLCNPHNPGGTVWTRQELTDLGNLCLEKNVVVVSDEIHADLVFQGNRHTPFANISESFAQNSIVAMSASKTFNIAGLSSAFLVIPDKQKRLLYKQFMRATHLSSGNFFGLVATEAAFKYGDEWLNQLLRYLEGNLQFVEDYLATHLPGLRIMKPEGTYLIWIDLSALSVSAKKACELMVEAGVGLSPGFLFGTGGENYVRLNMGCPRSLLLQGLRCMKLALENR